MAKNKNFNGSTFFGAAIFVFLIWTFRIWRYSNDHPDSFGKPAQPQNQNSSLPANDTLAMPQPCDDSNWSAGSAFFTLTALTFGYIAHPGGCMIFDRAGRMWRLTPLFALLETCSVWGMIVFGATRQPRNSFRVMCHALMAVRLCNSWHPFEIAEALEPDERNDEEAEEGHLLHAGSDEHTESLSVASFNTSRGASHEAATSAPVVKLTDLNSGVVGRSATKPRPSMTWPIIASPETITVNSSPNISIHSPEETTTPAPSPLSKYQLEEAESSAALEQLINTALGEVSKYDHGPSYRIFIWIPMVLQIIKLLVVSGSGSLLTQVSGWAYFISWGTIELFMITVAQRPLDKAEIIRATSLCKKWTSPLKLSAKSAQPHRSKFQYKNDTSLPYFMWLIGSILAGTIAIYNAGLTLGLLFHDVSFGDSYLSRPEGFFGAAFYLIKTLLLYAGILVILAIAGFLIAFPAPMLLAQKILLLAWKSIKRLTALDFGNLWFEGYLNDLQPMWPAYIAMYNFMILMLFHTGIWWWQPFQCWETRKPDFYDWLG